MNKLPKKVNRILAGDNEQVQKVEPFITKHLSKLTNDVQGREGEELAGTLNYHIVEINTLMRKAAAIGYIEALADNNLDHHHEISLNNNENRQGQIL